MKCERKSNPTSIFHHGHPDNIKIKYIHDAGQYQKGSYTNTIIGNNKKNKTVQSKTCRNTGKLNTFNICMATHFD